LILTCIDYIVKPWSQQLTMGENRGARRPMPGESTFIYIC
jgi:hypothetical protein